MYMKIKQLKLNGVAFYPKVGVDSIVDAAGTKSAVDTVVTENSINLITSGAVYNSVPTKTSDLTNDSNFVNQSQLSGKQDLLVSGTNIKTVNGNSLLSSGNIDVVTDLDDHLDNQSENAIQNKPVAEAIEAIDGRVGALEDAIGDGGSIDERIEETVSAAKSEIKGNATLACDTLGKAEALITAEVSARVNAVSTEVTRAQAAETAILNLYQSLSQSAIEVVDTLPPTGNANNIYRLVGTTSYSDYMYNTDDLNTPILMATYNNAIENEPTPGSNNLVKSGGVAAAIVFDISAYHATGSTLATYSNLSDSLGPDGANVPASVRKGGMSVKFVQSSDNKYVQYRLMSDTFNTTVANWQGVDDVPTVGSDNQVKSGGVAEYTKNIELEEETTLNEAIRITDDDDTEVIVKISKEYVDAKNLKSNGKDVLTDEDIETLKQKTEQIDVDKSHSIEEEQIWQSDDGLDTYVKIGAYGLKTKSILNINGAPFISPIDKTLSITNAPADAEVVGKKIQELYSDLVNVGEKYQSELETTLASINSKVTSPCLALNIITDTHYKDNYIAAYTNDSTRCIRAINNRVFIDGVVHLGDSIGVDQGLENELLYQQMQTYLISLSKANKNFYPINGNHDGANSQTFLESIWNRVVGRSIDEYTKRYEGSPYFYFDHQKTKTRCIFLALPDSVNDATPVYGFTERALNWFANEALDCPIGYSIILFSHIPLLKGLLSNIDEFYSLCSAFNTHTVNSGSINADYTSKTGCKIIIAFSGHEHCDLVAESGWSHQGSQILYENGMPCSVVIIGSGLVENNSGSDTITDCGGIKYTRSFSNYTNLLFDTMVYRPDESKIYMYRFGAGVDRIINI